MSDLCSDQLRIEYGWAVKVTLICQQQVNNIYSPVILQTCLGNTMPAERKKSANMDEKESLLNNKEKEFVERRPVSTREKPKDDVKVGVKRETVKVPEDKKKKLDEDKRKKEDKERKKKEEDKVKAEEEQKKKEEEEKKKHEEEEKKKQEEEAKRQQEEAAAQLK